MRQIETRYRHPCPKCGMHDGHAESLNGPYSCRGFQCGHVFHLDDAGNATSHGSPVMDSDATIHERSVRLIDSMNDLQSGKISLGRMMQIIDEEEKNVVIPHSEDFFNGVRNLSQKIVGHRFQTSRPSSWSE